MTTHRSWEAVIILIELALLAPVLTFLALGAAGWL